MRKSNSVWLCDYRWVCHMQANATLTYTMPFTHYIQRKIVDIWVRSEPISGPHSEACCPGPTCHSWGDRPGSLNSCPIAAVTNHLKFRGLKQEVRCPKIKTSARLCSFWSSSRESISLPFPVSKKCLHFLAHGPFVSKLAA